MPNETNNALVAEQSAQRVLELAEEKVLRLLYNANLDVNKAALICNKIVVIQEDIREIKQNIGQRTDDFEHRLRFIERSTYKYMGILMIVPPIVTIAIAWIISRFK